MRVFLYVSTCNRRNRLCWHSKTMPRHENDPKISFHLPAFYSQSARNAVVQKQKQCSTTYLIIMEKSKYYSLLILVPCSYGPFDRPPLPHYFESFSIALPTTLHYTNVFVFVQTLSGKKQKPPDHIMCIRNVAYSFIHMRCVIFEWCVFEIFG